MLYFRLVVDVIGIERTNENFRLIYDTKGRFAVHRITPEEAKVKCEILMIATKFRKFFELSVLLACLSFCFFQTVL